MEGLSSLVLPPKRIESVLVMAQFEKRPCEGGCFSFFLLLGHSSHNPLLCSFTQTLTLWLCPASEKGPCGQRQKALSCLLGLRSELTASHTVGFLRLALVVGQWDGAWWQLANHCRLNHIVMYTQNPSWQKFMVDPYFPISELDCHSVLCSPGASDGF